MTDGCSIPGCRDAVAVVYLDRGVCTHHWDQLTAEDQPADALARALGIQVANATTMEVVMAEKKATKKAKAAKEPKVKKEKTGPVPDRVFAIRVTTPELDALHKAAGKRNATRLVRALTVAFVNEDSAAFKAIVEEARQARA